MLPTFGAFSIGNNRSIFSAFQYFKKFSRWGKKINLVALFFKCTIMVVLFIGAYVCVHGYFYVNYIRFFPFYLFHAFVCLVFVIIYMIERKKNYFFSLSSQFLQFLYRRSGWYGVVLTWNYINAIHTILNNVVYAIVQMQIIK